MEGRLRLNLLDKEGNPGISWVLREDSLVRNLHELRIKVATTLKADFAFQCKVGDQLFFIPLWEEGNYSLTGLDELWIRETNASSSVVTSLYLMKGCSASC